MAAYASRMFGGYVTSYPGSGAVTSASVYVPAAMSSAVSARTCVGTWSRFGQRRLFPSALFAASFASCAA